MSDAQFKDLIEPLLDAELERLEMIDIFERWEAADDFYSSYDDDYDDATDDVDHRFYDNDVDESDYFHQDYLDADMAYEDETEQYVLRPGSGLRECMGE